MNTQETSHPHDVLEDLERFEKDKKAAGRFSANRIDKALRFKTECHYARQIILDAKGDRLRRCAPETLLECIADVALLGLTLAPNRRHAYLIPRWVKERKTNVATLYTSYLGLQAAAKRWGGLADAWAKVIYANEPHDIREGSAPSVEHQIITNAASRGPMIGAYCVAHMTTGLVKVEYMDLDQIERAKQCSEGLDSKYHPWNRWPEEMARKTVMRRASKAWGGSPEMDSSIQVQHKYEGLGQHAALDALEGPVELLTEDQVNTLHARLTEADMDATKVFSRAARVLGVGALTELGQHRFAEAEALVQKAIDHKAARA